MVGQLQPLAKQFAIVDDQGRPTDYFTRWAQQRQIDISDGISAAEALQIVADYVNTWSSGRDIIAGIALDGGGPLSADVTIDHSNSTVTPGTYGDATHVPQLTVDQQGHVTAVTNVTISGGGGSGTIYANSMMADFSASASAFATKGVIFQRSLGVITVNKCMCNMAATSGATYIASIVIINTSTGAIFSVLGSTVAQSFATLTTAKRLFTFTSPIVMDPSTLTANQFFAVMWTRTNGTTTFVLPIEGTAGSDRNIAGISATRLSSVTVASILPTAGQVASTFAAGSGYNIALICSEVI